VTRVRVVDALGTYCPVPVRLLASAARSAEPGTLIELLADDPLAEIDVPAWCHSHGHRVRAVARDDGSWAFAVVVGGSSPPDSAREDDPAGTG
jgi:tRNA 2-thiouridine synthesizing protein A